jgi:AraC-like DNA-binding protein
VADYISTAEAAAKWGLTSRRIAILCSEGRVPGARLIGHSWAVPADAAKPADARIKSGQYVKNPQPAKPASPPAAMPGDFPGAFQKLLGNRDAFFQFLDLFPYMIEVFAPDGTLVFVNRKGCEDGNIPDASVAVGKYNILKDPVVLDVLGQREIVERAFQGERVTSRNVRFPYEDTAKRYARADKKFAKILYLDISCFPVWDEERQVMYTAMVFITAKTYTGRADMIRAREYMDGHWREPFNRDKIAAAAGVSPNHFSRMFRQHAGVAPLEYYHGVKVEKIMEKLLDPRLTIKEAFAACGAAGAGRARQTFQEIAGMTPGEYRKRYMEPKKR